MAFKRKSNDDSQGPKINLAAVHATVTNARAISDDVAVFTLKCAGFSFYNLRLVPKKDKPNDYFIGIPSTKGKDGNYYKQYALYLSDEAAQSIIADVLTALE